LELAIQKKMLKSTFRALIKMTNLKMLYWKIVKCYRFDFWKVKKIAEFNANLSFLVFLTRALKALVNTTLKKIIKNQAKYL